jgi:hypothetical protein
LIEERLKQMQQSSNDLIINKTATQSAESSLIKKYQFNKEVPGQSANSTMSSLHHHRSKHVNKRNYVKRKQY